MRRISIILVAACALALPAAASAQSAGDNQYQDPLAAPHSRGNSGSSGSSGSGSTTPAPSQGSSTSSSGTAGTTGSSGAASPSATASTSGLPRTGGHPELSALAGLMLLGGGFGLRRIARV